MILTIAKHELLQFRRDGRLSWGLGCMLIMLIVSFLVGYHHQQQISHEHQFGQQVSYQHWINQGAVNPHAAAHFGMYVFKPSPIVSLFDPGINPYSGISTWLEAHRQNPFLFRPASDVTGLLRFGNFTTAWTLQVLGPLLLITLGFSAFASEREQGTLKQILSLGIPPWDLLWGKALALFLVMTILLSPILLMLFFATSDTKIPTPINEWSRITVILIGYALYLTGFIFLTLWVSARSRAAHQAIIILLSIWIVGVIVIPRASHDLSRQLYPDESQHQFAKHYGNGLQKAYKKVFKDLKATRWSEIPPNQFGLSMSIAEKYERQNADRHFARLWHNYERQDRITSFGSFFSPLLAIRSLSSGMAGTDLNHWKHFADSAENYRRYFESLVNKDNAQHGGDEGYNYRADPNLWKQVKEFQYTTPTLSWALNQCLISLMILVIMCGSTFFLALQSIRQLKH